AVGRLQPLFSYELKTVLAHPVLTAPSPTARKSCVAPLSLFPTFLHRTAFAKLHIGVTCAAGRGAFFYITRSSFYPAFHSSRLSAVDVAHSLIASFFLIVFIH
ncbi:unnamed protein product, partial [Phaeothamnion confervicola]